MVSPAPKNLAAVNWQRFIGLGGRFGNIKLNRMDHVRRSVGSMQYDGQPTADEHTKVVWGVGGGSRFDRATTGAEVSAEVRAARGSGSG